MALDISHAEPPKFVDETKTMFVRRIFFFFEKIGPASDFGQQFTAVSDERPVTVSSLKNFSSRRLRTIARATHRPIVCAGIRLVLSTGMVGGCNHTVRRYAIG